MEQVAEWLETSIYDLQRMGSWDKVQVREQLSLLFSLCLGQRAYELGDLQRLAAYLTKVSPKKAETYPPAIARESTIASVAHQVSAMPEDPSESGVFAWLIGLFTGSARRKEVKFENDLLRRLESFGFICRQIGIEEPKIEAGGLTEFLQEALRNTASQPVD